MDLETKQFLNSTKVGDTVVLNNDGTWQFAKVEKKTDKTLVVNGRTFYVPKYGWNLTGRKRPYESAYSTYSVHPADAQHTSFVKKAEANALAKAQERENEKAEEASNQAEADAYFATEEGKAFLALQTDWLGAKIKVIRLEADGLQSARKAKVVVYAGEKAVASVDVRQPLDYKWDNNNTNVVQRSEVNWNGNHSERSGQAKVYAQAMLKAVELAELWDRDAGKIWNREAGVAITLNECAPVDNEVE